MKQFEYLKVTVRVLHNIEELNKIGSDGWELCVKFDGGSDFASGCIFKRELENVSGTWVPRNTMLRAEAVMNDVFRGAYIETMSPDVNYKYQRLTGKKYEAVSGDEEGMVSELLRTGCLIKGSPVDGEYYPLYLPMDIGRRIDGGEANSLQGDMLGMLVRSVTRKS